MFSKACSTIFLKISHLEFGVFCNNSNNSISKQSACSLWILSQSGWTQKTTQINDYYSVCEDAQTELEIFLYYF